MTVKIGLVGTGTVGCGCLDVLKAHRREFQRHFGVDVQLVRVCKNRKWKANSCRCFIR